MAKRIVMRITPVRGAKVGRWRLTGIEGGRTVQHYYYQHQAIESGRSWGRHYFETGRLAQLVVHGRDMKIRFENTYGRDPRRYKG